MPRQSLAGKSPGPAASRKGKQVLAGRANTQRVPGAFGRSGNDDDTYLSLRCPRRWDWHVRTYATYAPVVAAAQFVADSIGDPDDPSGLERPIDDDVHLNAAPATTLKAARTTAVDIVRPHELPAVGPASLLRDTLLRTSWPRSTALDSSLSGSTGAPISSSSLSSIDSLFRSGFFAHGILASS